MIITLVGKDPQVEKDRVVYDYSIREFVTIKLVERMIDHLDIESTSIHKNSEEAKKQIERKSKRIIMLYIYFSASLNCIL